MTGTPIESAGEFTAEAAARLDDYLRQVRLALRGVPGVSADEVEADIRDHVTTALRAAPTPVALARLEPVLEALGPPAGWRPAGAGAAGFDWRAALAALRQRLVGVGSVLARGPEDWRLAYLCLAFTALAVPTFGVGLVVAYLLGRAAIELSHERGQALGARRWLVYPAVVAVSLPTLVATLLWPVAVAPVVLEAAVWPAETYRDVVQSVAPDGTVQFRAGAFPAGNNHRFGQAGITSSGSGPANRLTYRIRESDRAARERTLAVMDALPVPRYFAGPALALFAAAGGLLAWWLLVGVTRRAFPHATAMVFHPFLSPEARGVPAGLFACGVALAAWLGAAHALFGG